MPFIVLAYDETDADCINRRMANREAHLAAVAEAVESGNQAFGAALTDESGRMIGSLMVMDYPTRTELDAAIARDPYVTGRVWGKIEVLTCAVPHTFAHLFKKNA